MIELSVESMAASMGADLLRRGQGGIPSRAEIDSRKVTGEEIFFGLTGGSSDGGEHAAAALDAGAWGVVVEPDRAAALAGRDAFIFASEDPLLALQMLARAWRRKLGATVIGITGSVGKTSVKDITRALLPGVVHASAENFNTEIGLPLTVLEAPSGTETLVLEMAMRGEGQIAELAMIAEPDIGVITNVGPVHVELLGSIEGVARAKAELIAGLKADGTLIAPVRAGHLEPHLDGVSGLVRFGEGGDVAFAAEPAAGTRIEVAAVPPGRVSMVDTNHGQQEFAFPFTEAHNLTNALAAIAAGIAAGATPAELAARTGDIAFSRLRNEHIDLGEQGVLINDCYNANPVSMRAALEHLASFDRGNKVAVLGLMGELGPGETGFHQEIGELARELGIDRLIGVGEVAKGYRPDLEAADTTEAARLAIAELGPETVILIKGSRSAGLEEVSDLVVKSAENIEEGAS